MAVKAEQPQRLESLGQDPYEAGWIARIKPDNPADIESLLDQAAYDALLAKQSH